MNGPEKSSINEETGLAWRIHDVIVHDPLSWCMGLIGVPHRSQ